MSEMEKSDYSELPTEGQRLCVATKRDGTPCRAPARVGDFCVGHAPGANEARAKGGTHSSKKCRLDAMLPLRLRPVLELLEKAIKEVHDGELSASKATALASLAGAICKVFESGLFEQRLLELESRFGTGKLLAIRQRKEVTELLTEGS